MSSNWSVTQRAAIESRLMAGESPTHIANDLGVRRESVRQFGKVLAASSPDMGNVQDQFSMYEQIHGQTKPRIRVPYRVAPEPANDDAKWHPLGPDPRDAPITRVLALGDIHAKPGRTHEPVILAARHAAETRPHRVVSIGDWLSLDSCSFHSAKGTRGDMSRPTFAADLENGEESLWSFDRYAPPASEVKRDITLGNHEHRSHRVAELDPKLMGDAPLRVNQVFSRYGFRTHEFGKYLTIDGVLLTHVPLNVMGKPYGGKHAENALANDSARSLVWGHDHRFRSKSFYRIGTDPDKITLVNLGTCMPFGEIEDYTTGVAGWSYGFVDLTIQAGQIISVRFWDLREAKELYGD